METVKGCVWKSVEMSCTVFADELGVDFLVNRDELVEEVRNAFQENPVRTGLVVSEHGHPRSTVVGVSGHDKSLVGFVLLLDDVREELLEFFASLQHVVKTG